MIPVAFLTYLFHEFGHWSVGELLGNKMLYSLNNVTTASENYLHETDSLFVLMGGPAFTILQAIIFLIVIEKTKSIYFYPFVFFAGFVRFFSIAAIVLLILFIIVWRSSAILKLNLKAVGYFTVLSVISILIVIATDKLIS